jgi:hemophore-related protein
MVTLSLTRLAAVTCGLALSLTVTPGLASAIPDAGSVADNSLLINTTCSYRQVATAIAARSPTDYNQFMASPVAQQFVQAFVQATPDERHPMITSIMTTPQAWRSREALLQFLVPAVNTCQTYSAPIMTN